MYTCKIKLALPLHEHGLHDSEAFHIETKSLDIFGAGLNVLPYDHNIEGFKRDLKEGSKFSCSDRTCDCGDTEDHEGCCCNS